MKLALTRSFFWFAGTLCLLPALPTPLQAQLAETWSFNQFGSTLAPALPIPDGDAAGVSDSRTISSAITTITRLEVSFQISSDTSQDPSGAFNGDLYLYLRHDSGFSVLLDRSGRRSTSAAGYDDAGFTVTLRDDAANGDIHFYRASQTPVPGLALTGIWQPDARTLDPSDSPSLFESAARTATLSSFNGLDASGLWVLYATDLQSGGAARIDNWTLQVSGVPEPAMSGLASALALACTAVARSCWKARRILSFTCRLVKKRQTWEVEPSRAARLS